MRTFSLILEQQESPPVKPFADLTEKEILALAISSEDDDARTYMSFANSLQEKYPASARVFVDMAEEEHEHRRRLTELFQKKFGDFIPLIRRSDGGQLVALDRAVRRAL